MSDDYHADDNGEPNDGHHIDHNVVVVDDNVDNALWKLCQIQLVPQQGHHHFFNQGAELFWS